MNEGSFIMSMIELRWPNTDGFSLSPTHSASYADVICGPEIGPAGLIRSSHPLAGTRTVLAAAEQQVGLSRLQTAGPFVFPMLSGSQSNGALAWAAADRRLFL